jgi:hypothetical protein
MQYLFATPEGLQMRNTFEVCTAFMEGRIVLDDQDMNYRAKSYWPFYCYIPCLTAQSFSTDFVR